MTTITEFTYLFDSIFGWLDQNFYEKIISVAVMLTKSD